MRTRRVAAAAAAAAGWRWWHGGDCRGRAPRRLTQGAFVGCHRREGFVDQLLPAVRPVIRRAVAHRVTPAENRKKSLQKWQRGRPVALRGSGEFIGGPISSQHSAGAVQIRPQGLVNRSGEFACWQRRCQRPQFLEPPLRCRRRAGRQSRELRLPLPRPQPPDKRDHRPKHHHGHPDQRSDGLRALEDRLESAGPRGRRNVAQFRKWRHSIADGSAADDGIVSPDCRTSETET